MESTVIRELQLGLIGKPVEVGIYQKDTDDWVGTHAGLLTSYILTPEKNTVIIAQSNNESNGSAWDPATQYILITVFV